MTPRDRRSRCSRSTASACAATASRGMTASRSMCRSPRPATGCARGSARGAATGAAPRIVEVWRRRRARRRRAARISAPAAAARCSILERRPMPMPRRLAARGARASTGSTADSVRRSAAPAGHAPPRALALRRPRKPAPAAGRLPRAARSHDSSTCAPAPCCTRASSALARAACARSRPRICCPRRRGRRDGDTCRERHRSAARSRRRCRISRRSRRWRLCPRRRISRGLPGARGDQAPVPAAQRRAGARRSSPASRSICRPTLSCRRAPRPIGRCRRSCSAASDPPRRVADLFAGLGTFTFALAATATGPCGRRIDARPWRRSLPRPRGAGSPHASTTRTPRSGAAAVHAARNSPAFDAVVFDPPRAGARAQAEALAGSAVPRIVAVSCNPATFARDARALVDGGYRLVRVQPIDSSSGRRIWSWSRGSSATAAPANAARPAPSPGHPGGQVR